LDDVWLATKSVFDEFIQNDVLSANAALLHAIQAGNEMAYQQLVIDDSNDDSTSCSKVFHDEMATMRTTMSASSSSSNEDRENGNHADILNQITNPTIEFLSGQKVTVAYDRPVTIKKMNADRQQQEEEEDSIVMMRETRVWVHQGPVLGWRNAECSRTPILSSSSSFGWLQVPPDLY
jgi:hypothetical protein